MEITFITDEELFERLQTSVPFYDGYRIWMIPKSESGAPILISTKESAKYLGTSLRTFGSLVDQKKIVPIKIDGKNHKFTREQLEEFARSLTVDGNNDVATRKSSGGGEQAIPRADDDEDLSPEALRRALNEEKTPRR